MSDEETILDKTTDVLLEVRVVRDVQDLKYGTEQSHDQSYWLAVLQHEMGQLASVQLKLRQGKDIDEEERDLLERNRKKLLDIAATAVAATESFDREYEKYFGHIQICHPGDS